MADFTEEFNEANKASDKFGQNFKEVLDTLRDSITSMGDKINDALKQAIKQNNNFSDAVKRRSNIEINRLASGLDKVVSSLEEQSDLTTKISRGINVEKEILKEKEKLEKEIEKIRKKINYLENEGIQILEEDKELLEERIGASFFMIKVLEKENSERVKSLGIIGRLASGIDGIIQQIDKTGELSKILDLKGAVEKTREFTSSSDKSVGAFQKMGVLTKNIGTNLLGNIAKLDIMSLIIKETIEAIIHADKATGELAKKFGLSYNQAQDLKGQLTNISATSSDVFVTTENLQKVYTNINEALGTKAELNKEELIFLTKLGERAGYSVETQQQLYKLFLLTGKSSEQLTKEFDGQVVLLKTQASLQGDNKKAALNEKQLFESINKISASTVFALGGQTDKLAEAVIEAKALGTELDTISKISDALLDIESSLENQMQAQLFLQTQGMQLDLTRAREAALARDKAGVAREIQKQINSLSKEQFATLQGNELAMRSMAQWAGVSVDEFSEMLNNQKILQQLGAKEGQDLKSYYDELVRVHGAEKAASIIKQKTGDETLANQMASVTMQEEFNQSVQKLKEIFVSIAKPIIAILKPIMDILSPILGALTDIVQLALIPLTESIKVIVDVTKEIFSPLIEAGKEIFGIFSEIFGVKSDSIFGSLGGILKEISSLFYKGVFYPAKVIGTAIVKFIITPMRSFYGIIGGIVDIFKGDFEQGIEKIGNSLLKFLVSPIQFVLDLIIGGINGIIKLANKISSIIPGIEKISEIKEIKLIDDKSKIEADDMYSPGYGKRILSTPEGSIHLNNNDSIIAGTNLLNKKGENNQEIINELKTLKQLYAENNKLLSQILNKPGIINMDGFKVGEILNSGTNSYAL